jgi:hypothetical protein
VASQSPSGSIHGSASNPGNGLRSRRSSTGG